MALRKLQRFARKKGEEEDDTNQLTSLGHLIKENESHFDQILRLGQKHLRSSRLACEDLHGLADNYCEYADSVLGDEDDGSVASSSLRLTSDFIHISQHRKSDLLREFDSKVLVPLRKFMKGELLTAKEQKKKHSRLRDKYEGSKADLEAAKSNKKTTQERKKEMEDSCAELKTQFEESKYETHSVFLDCTKQNELVVAQAMIDSFETFSSFHSSCAKWLEQKRSAVDDLKEKLKAEREASEQKRLARAAQTPAQQKLLLEKNALFGTPLKTTLLRDKNRGVDCVVPLYVRKIIDWVIQNGLKEEGIFRISGNQNHVKEWTDRIDRGESIDLILDPKGDPHLLCSLLKLYIRELPEPLCTISLYDSFLDFGRLEKSEREVGALKEILMKLPPSNYYLFREIITLCHHVVAHEGHNKMSAANMGTVMAPNLFHKTVKGDSVSPQDLLVTCSFDDMKLTSDLFVFLTENYKVLFEDDPQFLIDLGANTSEAYSVDGSQKTLDHVLAVDPPFSEDVQQVLPKSQRNQTSRANQLSSVGGHKRTPSAGQAPSTGPSAVHKGLPARNRSVVSMHETLRNSTPPAQRPNSPDAGCPLSLRISGSSHTDLGHGSPSSLRSPLRSPIRLSPPLSPLPSPPPITLSPSRSSVSSPSLPPPIKVTPMSPAQLPPSLVNSPLSRNSPSSPQLSTPGSPSLPPSIITPLSPEPPKKSIMEPAVQPVYQRIALDPLVEALGGVVLVGCHTEFQQDAVEPTNAALAQIAQPLKQMFSNSECSIRSFSGTFSESSKQAISKAGLDLQGSAKKVVRSARQVYSDKSDASQRGLAGELNKFVGSIRQLLTACDKACFEVILGEAQSLTKCLSEVLSYVKVGADPQSFKDISSSATLCVLRFNQLVKTRALQLPDREMQSRLSQSCASIASLTADLSRQSFALMSSPAEFRNLKPVGTKAKAIISELRSINSVILTPVSEHFLALPGGDVLGNLRSQGEIAIERACLVLERAGDDEVFRIARETLPSLLASLFIEPQGDRRKLMENTLAFVKTTKGACERAEEIASGGGESAKHKISVFSHALEHLFRLALVSVASYCVAPYGSDGPEPFLVPSLPYVTEQTSACFLQLLSTVFPNE